MTIVEFEKNVSSKYKVEKVTQFEKLKKYLMHDDSYLTFTPHEVSEGFMDDDEFFAAYVFDEESIIKREIRATNNSGWRATIVFISSMDNVEIDDYFVQSSGALTNEEYRDFLVFIDDLIVSPDKKVKY